MVSARKWTLGLAWMLSVGAGAWACEPSFTDRISVIEATTVLAVQATPAQAAPGASVSYKVLVAGPSGTVAAPELGWSYCELAKPVAEINDVSTACFEAADGVTSFGSGATASGAVPTSACRQFGPDVPTTAAGEDPGRPADPDATGGYYQPVILKQGSGSDSELALGQVRLKCNESRGTAKQLTELSAAYQSNENPELTEVLVVQSGSSQPLTEEGASSPLVVKPGAKLKLRASWASCPSKEVCGDGVCTLTERASSCAKDCTAPLGCQGSEPYLAYDTASSEVKSRQEAIRLSWSATAGSFESDHTGSSEAEYKNTSSENTWTAPSEGGKTAHLWVVIRDDRGGVSWKSFDIAVK